MIDHIDRNKLNNNIENLRHCNSSSNNANAIYKKGKYSKLAGVSWHKHHNLFTSSIKKMAKYITWVILKQRLRHMKNRLSSSKIKKSLNFSNLSAVTFQGFQQRASLLKQY